MAGSIDILVVGAGFGADFLPLYRAHPLVGSVALCDPRLDAAQALAERHRLDATYGRLEEALGSGRWDAVHLVTPVRFHVEQTLQVLATGRACASAVPMATSLDGINRVMDVAAHGRYMMMETSLYHREYLYARTLRDEGRLGRISYLSGYHMQDLDGYPEYWMGYAPMHYATHVMAPILGLAGAQATAVSAMGSGNLLEQHRGDGSNPFPIETALFRLGADTLAAQVTMSFFENAREYTEGFNVYGDLGAIEWPSIEGGESVTFTAGSADGVTRGRAITRNERMVPDRFDGLPDALLPFAVGGSHGGSHPHLANEFVSAVYEGRRSAIDEVVAARITAPGIVAHESAMRGGELLPIPQY